jgi:hypothetical protein
LTGIVNQTLATQDQKSGTITTVPVVEGVTNTQTITKLIYFSFGMLEALLVFRLIFKLTGASAISGFVSLIYGVTGIFILPFEGIFRSVLSQGVETTSILEPAVAVAIVVYALVAWGLVKLAVVLSRQENA